MFTRRLYIAILLLAVGCQQAAVSTESSAAEQKQPAQQTEADRQLRINQDALMRGATEDIRVDAATIMLFSDSAEVRAVLIDVLRQPENTEARIAVCKALSQTRNQKEALRNKSDFIEPLVEVLRSEELPAARSAAEAALIFEYEDIAGGLELLATDGSAPVRARLNAIYALKLQLDIKAVSQLMDLLDDEEGQVAEAAAEALRSIGIPVGSDEKARHRILAELHDKGMERFQRDWLIRQEAQVSELERERNLWRKLYLQALDKIYQAISDESERAKFLSEHLNSPEPVVRLWGLEKVSQWRLGTQSKLPSSLGPVLIELISNPNREVRLKTAKLLSLMGELSSAERLLEQLKVEADEEVQTEIFVALGGACHYAMLPNSGIQLTDEIRTSTLEWAGRYLANEDSRKSLRGAEVIRKLHEGGDLGSETINSYLDLLLARYQREIGKADGVLRGELLGIMAGLCGQSAYKAEVVRRFGGLFEKALSDEASLVREAAVEGLANIDRTRALRLLRESFLDDASVVVRRRLIGLASEVGGVEDLDWLREKIGSNSESEPAWQAMLRIFDDSEVAVIKDWHTRFESQGGESPLSDEQWLSFLEIAERKATGENNAELVKRVREDLATVHAKMGRYERAAEYLGQLRQVAQSPEEKDAVLASLLEVYLRWPKLEAATRLVSNILLEKDLEPDDAIVVSINGYFANPGTGADPNAVLAAFKAIDVPQSRPMWGRWLAEWTERLAQGRQGGGAKSGA